MLGWYLLGVEVSLAAQVYSFGNESGTVTQTGKHKHGEGIDIDTFE